MTAHALPARAHSPATRRAAAHHSIGEEQFRVHARYMRCLSTLIEASRRVETVLRSGTEGFAAEACWQSYQAHLARFRSASAEYRKCVAHDRSGKAA